VVAPGGRAGVRAINGGQGFAPPTGPAAGNNLPASTGVWSGQGPGPAPPGQVAAGQLGGNDGQFGPDPRSPQTDPAHVSVLGTNQESTTAYGLAGFNDKQTVWDRHVYWDAGTQRTGTTAAVPGNPPNPVTDGPARPGLRALSRVLSWQIGSDATANQDDLSRAYTWLGEQGSGYSPVYGGVPGLYVPYGTRGGVPYPISDPTDGLGGRSDVWAGPPHGLHSLTFPDGADMLNRYRGTPQMRRPRLDRPANSPQAGQSYSQTVMYQGGSPVAGQATSRPVTPLIPGLNIVSGRGWAGGA
jgi:hypothetical protein